MKRKRQGDTISFVKAGARVAVLMGSAADDVTMKQATGILKKFGVACVERVLVARRAPREAAEFVASAEKSGVVVFIATAGAGANLAGAVAARTSLPVIGVPIASGGLKGLDSLLATLQMPEGTPVAAVAVGSAGAKNAAYLALRILALADKALEAKYVQFKDSIRKDVLKQKLDIR